ncbi:hypothetical protein T03_5070 [Trichinella britovi]|uniref:Uncharacterized protein n=1 Tax=Trichinella britovi TaxID=45882 RepID=A0A0V1AP14_TRIBR|nr:hypothetical protein T03_5070 [Trichinella britovi]
MALLPHCDFLNTIVNRFCSVQSRKLSIIAKRCHLLYADSRLQICGYLAMHVVLLKNT